MFVQKIGERFRSIDAAWLRMERPNAPAIVSGLFVFDEPLAFNILVEKLSRDLLPFRRFRQRVRGWHDRWGRPYWEEDPHFSLERHLQRVALAPAATECDLHQLIAQHLSQPLPQDRPLWQATLIENVGPSNALLFRSHHGLADGFSFLYLLMKLVDSDCELRLPRVSQPAAPVEQAEIIRLPGRVVDFLRASFKLLTLPHEPRSCLRQQQLGPRRTVAFSRAIPLEEVKQAAQKLPGTINDFLLAAITGALRRYVIQQGEDGLFRDMTCVMPVNIMPLEKRNETLGNGFSLVFVELPVGISDRQERVRVLQRQIARLKQSEEPLAFFAIVHLLGILPNRLEQLVSHAFTDDRVTLAFSNMPGPVEPIRFAGCQIKEIMFWVPQMSGQGLGLTALTYAGMLRVSLSADSNALPQPEQLLAHLYQEMNDLAGKAIVGT